MYSVCIILVSVKDFLIQLSELRILADYQSMKLCIIMMKTWRLNAKNSQNCNITCLNGSKNPIKERNVIVKYVKGFFFHWLKTKSRQ